MIGGATLAVLAVMCRARFRTVLILGFVWVLLFFMGTELPDLTRNQLHEAASGSNKVMSIEIRQRGDGSSQCTLGRGNGDLFGPSLWVLSP